VTPTQLKAFACVVRLGSVKAAADELSVSEAAVSMHVAQLRRELDDRLFTRTSSGLAFTPGGLRLASRAVEILGLQDRTVREVSQAGQGRRLLRVASSSLFAVELSVHPTSDFATLLSARTVDLAIGPVPRGLPPDLLHKPFLNYEVLAVAGPQHPLAGRTVGTAQAREQTWLLGPSAAGEEGVVPGMLRQLGIPESRQRIFQSDAGALEETKRTNGIALAVRFAVSADLAAGRLGAVEGPGMRAQGRWAAISLPASAQLPAAAELLRFITTPRATQAMVHGSGVTLGRFKPSVHVTLWS
jgi:DNA-binding transcriptional LysR family regulator